MELSVIIIKHQADGTQLLIYIYIHVYILPYFHHSKMITLLVLLLLYWTKNLNELYSNIHFLVFYNWLSYFILIVSNLEFYLPLSLMNFLLIFNDIHGKPKPLVVTLTVRSSKCVCICSRDLHIYFGRLSLTINIPMVVYFAYGITFDFYVQLYRSIFQKNPGAMAIALVQEA